MERDAGDGRRGIRHIFVDDKTLFRSVAECQRLRVVGLYRNRLRLAVQNVPFRGFNLRYDIRAGRCIRELPHMH